MGYIGSLEPQAGDFASELILMSLGSSGRRYARETRAACRRIVSEVYSPPRVTAELKRQRHKHLVAGLALDVTMVDPDDGMPWDFNLPSKRAKARRKIEVQKPFQLIGSPMCTAFSAWQHLNEAKSKDVEAVRRAKLQAIVHIDFVAELYQAQIDGGRYFLHEHPWNATSWQLDAVKKLLAVPSVQRVRGDQCQFGAEVQRGPHKSSPVMSAAGS